MRELCPSILSADFNVLGQQLTQLEEAGVKWLHIDVMDGMFVPDISFGMPVIRSIRSHRKLIFDTHLMIVDPLRYIEEFADCGSDSITFHLEAANDVGAVIAKIRECGKKVGLSIKPKTPVEAIRPYAKDLDLVLVMTVEPGFGGQPYIQESTQRIAQVKEILREENSSALIQVDGGIKDATLPLVLGAGANLIVTGSWVFGGDLPSNVKRIQGLLKEE